MSPIYQYIYKATYDFYLGFVYVVAMGILGLMLVQTIYVFFFLKKYDRQMKMAELSTQDQDTSENNKDNIDSPNGSWSGFFKKWLISKFVYEIADKNCHKTKFNGVLFVIHLGIWIISKSNSYQTVSSHIPIWNYIKFMFSKKATQADEIFTVDLTFTT